MTSVIDSLVFTLTTMIRIPAILPGGQPIRTVRLHARSEPRLARACPADVLAVASGRRRDGPQGRGGVDSRAIGDPGAPGRKRGSVSLGWGVDNAAGRPPVDAQRAEGRQGMP